jgi:hypothetical protein
MGPFEWILAWRDDDGRHLSGKRMQAKERCAVTGQESWMQTCKVKLAPNRPSPLESRPVTGPLKPASCKSSGWGARGAGLCRALQSFAESPEDQGGADGGCLSSLSSPLSLFVLSRPSRVGEQSSQAECSLREAVEGNSGIKVLEDAELTSGLWRHLFVRWWLKGRAGFWCEEGELRRDIRFLIQSGSFRRSPVSRARLQATPSRSFANYSCRSASIIHPSSLNHLQGRSRTGSQVFICIMARPRAGFFPEECSSCERSTPCRLHIHSSSISLPSMSVDWHATSVCMHLNTSLFMGIL